MSNEQYVQTKVKSRRYHQASFLDDPLGTMIVDLTPKTNNSEYEAVGFAKEQHPAKKCRIDTAYARKSALDAGEPGPIGQEPQESLDHKCTSPPIVGCKNDGKKEMKPIHFLPSTGSDVLLVGARTLCQPLANALVRCKFGTNEHSIQSSYMKGSGTNINKRKLSSSRMTVTYSLNARHIRLTQTLPLDSSGGISFPRVDFVVIVVSVRDVRCFDFLRQCIAGLHSDYLLSRCAIVALHTIDRAGYGVSNSEVKDLLSPNEVSCCRRLTS